jgi:hypothetical protein
MKRGVSIRTLENMFIESVGRMTDRQIAVKVREHYQGDQ